MDHVNGLPYGLPYGYHQISCWLVHQDESSHHWPHWVPGSIGCSRRKTLHCGMNCGNRPRTTCATGTQGMQGWRCVEPKNGNLMNLMRVLYEIYVEDRFLDMSWHFLGGARLRGCVDLRGAYATSLRIHSFAGYPHVSTVSQVNLADKTFSDHWSWCSPTFKSSTCCLVHSGRLV